MLLYCRSLWFLLFFVAVLHPSTAKSTARPFKESPQSDLITQDVIHDTVEMDVKKVIRINPLDLPPLHDEAVASKVDSSLYKIQNLKPLNAPRNYINVRRRSPPLKEVTVDSNYSGVTISRAVSLWPSPDKTSKVKHQPKRKNLHFLYNQTDLAGQTLSKSLPVHVTDGAYPVYYVHAKTNGRFGKYPLKSFGSAQDFDKYLQKNKIENTSNQQPAKETV